MAARARVLWPVAVVCLCLAAPAVAGPEKVALAYPAKAIVVDGDLSDWPEGLHRYPIAVLGDGDEPAGADDFSADFRVAYNAGENALYVAVEVVDSDRVPGTEGEGTWSSQDGCELYLWGIRSHRSPPTQYWVRGPNQGVNGPGSSDEMQAVVRQTATGYAYEWRIDVTEANDEMELVAETAIGFDVALVDVDSDGTMSWIAWSRGGSKWSDANRIGRLILADSSTSVDRVAELVGSTVETRQGPSGEPFLASAGNRMFLSGILVAFTVLHFLLFTFDKRNRANLFYALYTGLIALSVFTGFQLAVARYLSPDRTALVKDLAISGTGAVGLWFLYTLFAVSPPRRIRYLIAGLLLAAALVLLALAGGGVWGSGWAQSAARPLLSLLGVGVFVETLLALLNAVRGRREGAWTIGIGFSVFALNATSLISQTEIEVANLYWVGIPLISMSVYLARSVARTNRALQAQLVQVEQLSRKTQEQYEQIQEQNRQVQEASRMKSDFLARMSHDLRTPMNAIIGYTRILLRKTRDQIDARQYQNLQNIQISADNLLALINDILDLSKIEAGRMEVHPESVPVDGLLAECCSAVESLLRPGVELHRDLPAVPPVRTDPDRLRRAVMNVLSNAVKFTEQGRVEVHLRRLDDWTEIQVADTGIGIPAADLPFIFDEFRQAGKRPAGGEGTGLGLAIARRSLGLLRGTIEATSQEGRGSVFTIRVRDLA